MPLLSLFLTLTFLFQSGGQESAAKSPMADDPALLRLVSERLRIRNAARAACVPDEAELERRLLAGAFQPEQEAERATARGCFNFFTTYSGIPSGTEFAPEIECRPNQRLLNRFKGIALLNIFRGSDVASVMSDPKVIASLRTWSTAISPVVRPYNSAVLAHPAFPYRDLCRPASRLYRPDDEDFLLPEEYGFRDLKQTDRPIDVHEAARRGTLESLRRIISADPVAVHVPDVLELTPLAWSVIYNRPQHARLLLEAGAHPLGYRRSITQESPIMIASLARNRTMTALLRPAMKLRGLALPKLFARVDRSRSSPDMMTASRRQPRVRTRLFISAEGHVTGCAFEHAPGGLDTDCERARRGLIFMPAEGADGEPEASSLMFDLPVYR